MLWRNPLVRDVCKGMQQSREDARMSAKWLEHLEKPGLMCIMKYLTRSVRICVHCSWSRYRDIICFMELEMFLTLSSRSTMRFRYEGAS